MRIVIDTDIFIDYFRGLEKAKLFIKKIKGDYVVCYSSITEAELLSGKDCKNEKTTDLIVDFLLDFVMIPVDSDIAQLGGKLRREYEIELDDALIAATALEMKTSIITKNSKDFRKIPGLRVINPY